jgi:hypothetical protein
VTEQSLTACPWCGDDSDEELPQEPSLVVCLICGGWFVGREGRVDYSGTRRLAEAMPVGSG